MRREMTDHAMKAARADASAKSTAPGAANIPEGAQLVGALVAPERVSVPVAVSVSVAPVAPVPVPVSTLVVPAVKVPVVVVAVVVGRVDAVMVNGADCARMPVPSGVILTRFTRMLVPVGKPLAGGRTRMGDPCDLVHWAIRTMSVAAWYGGGLRTTANCSVSELTAVNDTDSSPKLSQVSVSVGDVTVKETAAVTKKSKATANPRMLA
jgi:hypothetical protein